MFIEYRDFVVIVYTGQAFSPRQNLPDFFQSTPPIVLLQIDNPLGFHKSEQDTLLSLHHRDGIVITI